MPRKKIMTYQTEQQAFAKAIRKIMKENNLTQEELGKILGVARQTIGQYAIGQSIPDVNIIYSIKEKFGLSADHVLGYAEATKPSNEMILKELGINENACEILKSYIKKDSRNRKNDKIKMLNFLIENIENDFLESLYNYLFHDIEIKDGNNNAEVSVCAFNTSSKEVIGALYNTTLTKYLFANFIETTAQFKNNIDKTFEDKNNGKHRKA